MANDPRRGFLFRPAASRLEADPICSPVERATVKRISGALYCAADADPLRRGVVLGAALELVHLLQRERDETAARAARALEPSPDDRSPC
jgi:hypothetical protein